MQCRIRCDPVPVYTFALDGVLIFWLFEYANDAGFPSMMIGCRVLWQYMIRFCALSSVSNSTSTVSSRDSHAAVSVPPPETKKQKCGA